MADHSVIGPSAADKWVRCPGYAQMAPFFPQEDGDEAKEGRAAHWIAAEMLESYRRQGSPIINFDQVRGSADPEGTVITEQMFLGAKLYVDDVLAEVSTAQDMTGLRVEEKVYARRIHDQVWGTCDAWIFIPSMGLLIIWDFKFGHLDIPAFENWQLIAYYAGIADELALNGIDDQSLRVSLRAVQPRCFTENGPYKEWSVMASDLRGYVNQLRSAAEAALSPGAQTVSGNQCRYCPARHGCKSARQAAGAGIEYTYRAVPEILSDDALSYELAALEDAESAIKYRKEALEQDALDRIRGGKSILGYGAAHGRGKRQWKPGAYIDGLQQMYEVDLMEPPQPVTVAEAERRFKAKGLSNKQTETLLNGTWETPSKGLKLIRSKTTDARRIFSQE